MLTKLAVTSQCILYVTDNKQNRAERSLKPLQHDAHVRMQPLQNDAHVPNFKQPSCFTSASPQRLVHNKMQYLETINDVAFEIFKEKFQYVFDQLERQNQATSGCGRAIRLLPARARCCRFQLVLLRYSLVKAHLLKYLFLFGFVKTG